MAVNVTLIWKRTICNTVRCKPHINILSLTQDMVDLMETVLAGLVIDSSWCESLSMVCDVIMSSFPINYYLLVDLSSKHDTFRMLTWAAEVFSVLKFSFKSDNIFNFIEILYSSFRSELNIIIKKERKKDINY